MKYVLSILLAAALGTGIWYFGMRGHGQSGAPQGASGARAGFGGRGSEVPLVTVERVRKQQLSNTIEAIGTAKSNESVTLTAKVTDTVTRVDFDDGAYVKAGDILVQLTNKQEEADLAEAQANLDDADTSLSRIQDMYAKKLAPKSDLDAARAKAAAAKAHFDSLAAKLQDRLIRAPFSGVLGFRQVSPGTLVQPSTAITTLDDISTIKLDFTVPETYVGELKVGAPVAARSASYPDREFHGVVRTVGTRIDPVTRAVQVRAHIPNDDRLLKPGMLMTVDITTSTREALVVPESAVYQIADKAYVYRVDGDRVAHEREIQIGAHRYGIIEVKSGLAEGDLVVTQGIVKLHDGSHVRFEDVEPAPEVSRTSAGDAAQSGLQG